MLTGLAIGGANAFVYGLLGMVDSKMKLKSFYVSIEPELEPGKLSVPVCIR